MKLVNENYELIDNQNSVGQYFWYYDHKSKDFYLHWIPKWDILETNLFYFRINDKTVWVPDGFYILLAAPCGTLDWIDVGETIGRDLTCLVVDTKLEDENWSIYPFTPIGAETEEEIYFPDTNYPVLCGISETESIIVSKKDHYFKMRNHDITDIL